jgi:hypothetical protein
MSEEIEVVFEQEMELCFDGINLKKYKKGETYSPTHAHEKKMFEAFLEDGRATKPSREVKVKEAKPSEKIVKPKSAKSKK